MLGYGHSKERVPERPADWVRKNREEIIMSYIFYLIPMIAAGIVYRIICKTANVNSNTLLVIMLVAVAAAEYFIVSSQYGEEPTIGLGFVAALAYNLFKVRTDSEAEEA